MTKTITITSGKGGVGKTNTSLNLAINLAQLGQKVCLFDADFGMANINILLGLHPAYTIHDVILGQKTIQEIMMHNVYGIDILPGSSGIESMADISQSEVDSLLNGFSTLPNYDYLLFDTAAGISKQVLSFCLAATETILVITNEPTSLTDAYSLLKVLTANGYKGLIKVVINRCQNAKNASQTYAGFKQSVDTFLKREISPLGLILEDSKMAEAIRLQTPVTSHAPNAKSSKCFKIIAQKIIADEILQEDELSSFWQRCLGIMAGPIKMLPKSREKEGTAPPFRDESIIIAKEIGLLRQSIEKITKWLCAAPNGTASPPPREKYATAPPHQLDLEAFMQAQLLDEKNKRSETP